jgi:hypothetical protein
MFNSDQISLIIGKLVDALTKPESFILFLWVVVEKYTSIKREKEDSEVIDKLLSVQQSRGEVLARISTMIESMFRSNGK